MSIVIILVSNAQSPYMKHFRTQDGLSGGLVYYTMQDSKGYIWSTCEQGVSMFNGHEFQSFTIKDGLPSNDVWRIDEDKFGRLWMSTFGGICYYEDGKIKKYSSDQLPDANSMVEHQITYFGHFIIIKSSFYKVFLLNDLDELIPIPRNKYITTATEIIYKTFGNESNHSETINCNIDNIEEDIILHCKNNYYKLDSFEFNNLLKSSIFKTQWSFLPLSNDRLLFYSNKVVWSLHNGKLSKVELPFQTTNQDNIISIKEISINKIWIKIDNKNFIVDSLLQPIKEFEFLKEMAFHYLTEDRQGNFWLSTREGLSFINKKTIGSKTITNQELSFFDIVNLLAKDSKGDIWGLGSEGHLFKIIDDKNLKLLSTNPIGNRVTDMEFDPNDNLWIASDIITLLPNESIIKGSSVKDYREDLVMNKSIVGLKKIVFSNEGNPLVCTYRSAFQVNSNLEKDSTKFSAKGRFYGAACDIDGTFWLSGNEGVKHYNEAGIELIFENQKDHNIFKFPTDNIIIGANNQLWIAVNSLGLYHLNNGQIDSIPELKNTIIHSFSLDDNGSLWIASNKGIYKIYNVNCDTFSYEFKVFTKSNGLASNSVKDVIAHGTNIYAATDNGLSILKDTSWLTYEKSWPVSLSKIIVNGKDIPIDKPIDLAYHDNNISINYECLDYSDMENLSYEYKLIGANNNWIKTKSNEKEFSALSPGNYTFMVKRKQTDQSSWLILPITINEPWWNTKFAKLSLFCLMLLFGLLLIRYITIRIRKKSDAELLIKIKFAELELNSLQAQMNPHFIFNALQSIQDFILIHDPRTANKYLSKFSKLMRLFLESSREKYIKLNEEIELLRLYIDLEQLRFEDKFHYKINIDKKLEGELIEIPSMLIQPFVENAINHGLLYNESNGKLEVSFVLDDNLLICIIEDNGIGREKANEIKTKSTLSYKSRGMQLVKERLKVLNVVGNQNVVINIEDLYGDENISRGTRVTIKILLNS